MSMMKGSHKYQPVTKSIEMSNKLEEGEAAIPPAEKPKPSLSLWELILVLSPYFWPRSGSDGAVVNRIRSTSTWLMVACSKVSSLVAPFFLARATNDLVSGDMRAAASAMLSFSILKLAAAIFKEFQTILYIKVKQQASIELQELTFSHLHSLSLNWHLSKKTGSVMKSMDRGVEAANQLITYLFLFLMPAMIECLAVVVLFFINYQQWMLGCLVLTGVVLYSCATVIITQWRKKFREETNKHDNEFHDRATDSIINFETVKYFTGEEFEIGRFVKAVIQYQRFNSSTQLSLSLLNITQQVGYSVKYRVVS
jgi:ABC-type multidrug transport system fused ATPase/permease subunit